jgi:hypothetical protein
MANNNAMMIVVYGFLAILCVVMIVILFPLPDGVREGFQDENATPEIKCPKGIKSYIDKNGDTNCCRGEVNGNMCSGKIVCSLSRAPFCNTRERRKRYRGEFPPAFLSSVTDFTKRTPQPEVIDLLKRVLDDILKYLEKITGPRTKTPEFKTAMAQYRKFMDDEKYYIDYQFRPEMVQYEMTPDEQSEALAEELLYCAVEILNIFAKVPDVQSQIMESNISAAMCRAK